VRHGAAEAPQVGTSRPLVATRSVFASTVRTGAAASNAAITGANHLGGALGFVMEGGRFLARRPPACEVGQGTRQVDPGVVRAALETIGSHDSRSRPDTA